MVSVSEAKQIILKNTKVNDIEEINIKYALERVLAKNIKSNINIPCYNNSAMDGYALIAEFTKGATNTNPAIFNIIEEIKPGYIPNKKIKNNAAAAIVTGGVIPKGCDTVVIKEDTRREGNKLFVYREYRKNENIRYTGEDVKKGEVILKKGDVLDSPKIGMLAALGYTQINVYKRAKVGILSTGNEIIEPEGKLTKGKVRNSNAYSLYSLITQCNAEPVYLGIVKDDYKKIKNKIEDGLRKVDILITTAGISVSEYDIVKEIISELASIKFYKVKMRPGKPTMFAKTFDNKLIFGLPGNPVSSIVAFLQFVKLAIQKMQGIIDIKENKIKARLNDEVKKKRELTYFMRGILEKKNGDYFVSIFPQQGSGILKSLVVCNCLVEIEEGIQELTKGDKVDVILLRNYLG